jgi:glycosyl transferase family 2
VRVFIDPRIRFHNLPEHTGHQSAPHNKAVELARGEFVLFLNQDDMYFPDHISKRVAFMRETRAQISWSPVLLLQHSELVCGPVDVEKDRLTLDGVPPDGRFDPRCFIISSSWAVRREICKEVGPWMPSEKTRLSPSQEWLYRAHVQKRHIAYHPYVSVLCIHSGVRRYSYVGAHSFEHERAWTWLAAGAAERLGLLHCVAIQKSSELSRVRSKLERLKHPLRGFAEKILESWSVHPHSLQRYLAGLKKGDWVSGHKNFTSAKPPELPLNVSVFAGSSEAQDFFGPGWHGVEASGRWTGAVAQLFFTAPPHEVQRGNLILELCGHPFRVGSTVVFTLNRVPLTPGLGADEVTTITLPGPGIYALTISIDKPTSPKSLGLSDDPRLLGYLLTSLRLKLSPAAPEESRPGDIALMAPRRDADVF